MIQVHLYRPFSVEHFLAALPISARASPCSTAPRSRGAPASRCTRTLLVALNEASAEGLLQMVPRVIGGRYGLSSKEFTPAMVKGIFDELDKDSPKNHFTVGITDDVSHTSLDYDPSFSTEPEDLPRHVLRPWRRRHRRGEQEHHQDHRRGPGLLRAGLLRLRLQEVGLADGLPLAFRPAPDPLGIPDPGGRLYRLPPVRLHQHHGRARQRIRRGDRAAEQSVWA